MKKEIRFIGIRVSPEFHAKIHSLAEYEGRTLNQEVRYILQKYFREFEETNGPLDNLPKNL